jgi:tetratricopeptide (TPR) repeat protein
MKNSLDSPFPRVFETANIHFDAGRYERAAAILSSFVSKKHNDEALLENSLRLLADCYFFLGKGKDGSFNLKAVDAYKHILRRYPDLRSRNDLVNFAWQNAWNRLETMRRLMRPMRMSFGNIRLQGTSRMCCTKWEKFSIGPDVLPMRSRS